MKVSVVILNWNGADMLRSYLPSVVSMSSVTPSAEVIVADNGSTDDSLPLLHKDFPSVRVIELDRNFGFAEGYNKALRQIEADYYLLLNSDVEIRQKGWLNPLVEYMDSHADVAVCQPKLLSLKQPDRFEYAGAAGGFIDKYGYPFCRGRVFSAIEKDEGQYDTDIPLMWATGAALMVRSSDYWSVGGLDERFFAHMEEIDLCWRVRLKGRGVTCVPQSTAYHWGGATLNKSNPRKTFLNFRNNRLMLYKNLPESSLWKVMLVRGLLDMVAAVSFLCQGHFGDFKAVFKAYFAYRRLKKECRSVRADIQRTAVVKDVPERRPYFLLWRYHLRRQRTFSSLEGET